MKLDDVLRSLISVKHPKTILFFPSSKTLLDSRTRTRLSLILIWANSVPESLSSTMFYKTCFTLLDSFGHLVKYSPTLFHKTMLDGVLLVWTGPQHVEVG